MFLKLDTARFATRSGDPKRLESITEPHTAPECEPRDIYVQ